MERGLLGHFATGHWPGPVSGEQVFSLPAWAYPAGDDDISDLGLEMDL